MALCALGLGLRLRHVDQRSLWLDELNVVGRAVLSLPDFLQVLQHEPNMALYQVLLHVWLRVVGPNADEALIRLPSAVLGTAAIPLIYLLGRRLHSVACGLAAAALLTVNGFHVVMSQEARSYALFGSLILLSYLLLDRALERRRRRDWAWYGLVTALALHAHLYAVFSLLAQGLLVLVRRSPGSRSGVLVSGLFVAALLAPLLPAMLRQLDGDKLDHVPPTQVGDLVPVLVSLNGESTGLLLLSLVLATLGTAWTKGGPRSAEYRNWLLWSWLLVPVALAFAISLLRPILLPRYLFAILPALPLLASIGLVRLPRSIGLSTFGCAVVLSLWSLYANVTPPADEHWEEAVSFATASARPRDGWIFVSKRGQDGFEHYAWRWGRDPMAPYADVFESFDWREVGRSGDPRGIVSMSEFHRFADSRPRIWLIQSHWVDRASGLDVAAEVRDYLLGRGYQSTEQRFSGIRVLLFERLE